MSSILIRRANMVSGGNSPRLPAGYTELAYIETTGTQWMNIGHDGNCEFRIVAQATVAPTSSSLLVATSSSAGNWFGGVANGNWGAGPSNHSGITATTKAELLLSFTSTGVSATVNGASCRRNGSSIQRGNWYLFSVNGSYKFTGKVWELQQYQNDSLTMNLVPAMRDSDSVVGMYDLVSNTFLTNAGSGTFNYGTL